MCLGKLVSTIGWVSRQPLCLLFSKSFASSEIARLVLCWRCQCSCFQGQSYQQRYGACPGSGWWVYAALYFSIVPLMFRSNKRITLSKTVSFECGLQAELPSNTLQDTLQLGRPVCRRPKTQGKRCGSQSCNFTCKVPEANWYIPMLAGMYKHPVGSATLHGREIQSFREGEWAKRMVPFNITSTRKWIRQLQ